MALLGEQEKNALKEFFSEVNEKVEFILVTDLKNEETSNIAKELLKEVKEISEGKLDYEIKENDEEYAKKVLGDLINETEGKFGPLIIPKNKENMIFLGLPSGHEFAVFLEDIHTLDKKHVHADPDFIEAAKNLDRNLEILVFVTPTCPYCPPMTAMAHRFAYLNDKVKGIMVEAMEFPELANKYNVMGVPRTIIKENGNVVVDQEGAVPEMVIINQLNK